MLIRFLNCRCRTVLCSRYYTHEAFKGNEHNLRSKRAFWGSSSSWSLNSRSATAKSMLLGAHRQYSTHSPTETKSQKMLFYLTAVVFGMVGLTYAAVPLYRTFCQATGYGGTVQRKEVYIVFVSSFLFLILLVSLSQSFCLALYTIDC